MASPRRPERIEPSSALYISAESMHQIGALASKTELPDTEDEAPSVIMQLRQFNFDHETVDYTQSVINSFVTELGLNINEMSLIAVDAEDQKSIISLIDASPNGQYIGIYKTIKEHRELNPDWYTVKVDGKLVDPLQGCTKATYTAMIEEVRSKGEKFLPDSLALNQHNGHVWTATMLTGEPRPSDMEIWIASSSGGSKVNFVEHPIDRGGRSFRVRPAVVIAELG